MLPGSRYGYGDGYGYGAGAGYGDGDGDYWRAAVSVYSHSWTEDQRARLAAVKKAGATIAYWRSDAAGHPANGGSAPAVTIGTVQEERGPLNLCERGTLHATLLPARWQGERLWVVALHGEVVGDDEKMGALKREILGEAIGSTPEPKAKRR